MSNNRISKEDKVKVEISDELEKDVYTYSGQGFKNVENVIAAAYAKFTGQPAPARRHADEPVEKDPSFFGYYANPDRGANDIENYVFTVTNETTGTSARYRVNAGGHVRILPELHPQN